MLMFVCISLLYILEFICLLKTSASALDRGIDYKATIALKIPYNFFMVEGTGGSGGRGCHLFFGLPK